MTPLLALNAEVCSPHHWSDSLDPTAFYWGAGGGQLVRRKTRAPADCDLNFASMGRGEPAKANWNGNGGVRVKRAVSLPEFLLPVRRLRGGGRRGADATGLRGGGARVHPGPDPPSPTLPPSLTHPLPPPDPRLSPPPPPWATGPVVSARRGVRVADRSTPSIPFLPPPPERLPAPPPLPSV